MPLSSSPVIRRARLGAELRQLRRREALTLEQVCARLGYARLRIAAGQLLHPELDPEADLRARLARQGVLRRPDPPRALLRRRAAEAAERSVVEAVRDDAVEG